VALALLRNYNPSKRPHLQAEASIAEFDKASARPVRNYGKVTANPHFEDIANAPQ